MKLVINGKGQNRNKANILDLNNTLLNNQWIAKEIQGGMREFLELNDTDSLTFYNLWNTLGADS